MMLVGPLPGFIRGTRFYARAFDTLIFWELRRGPRPDHPEMDVPHSGPAAQDIFTGDIWQGGKLVAWADPRCPAAGTRHA